MPELAAARADELSGQFVVDGHTHFLRDYLAAGGVRSNLRHGYVTRA
ncbi:MAG: hypothetical protein HY067_13985 [Betaproteobacteria bacterium]|nr:hypothetical protein [Betaproteobacteria bacterium]